MEAQLKQLVDNFDANPVAAARARREMHEMLKQDGPRFFRAVVKVLQSVSDTAGYRYLFRLLLDQGLMYGLLCDPSNFSLDQAVAIARALQKLDPQADTTLARLLLKSGNGTLEVRGGEGFSAGYAEERILDIAGAISSGARLLPILVQLLKSPNQRVRSKATLLVGRMTGDPRVVEPMLSDPDPRTRADAVESLWGTTTPEAEAIFRRAAEADDSRTSANALVGLYRLGRRESIAQMLARAQRPEPGFRASAAWVMGTTGDPRFLPELKRMLADPDWKVRRLVLTAMAAIKRRTEGLSSLAPLQVFVAQPPGEAGASRLRASVVHSAGYVMTNVAPTEFIVWLGHSAANEFTVSSRPGPERLTVGFASAIFSRPAHPLHPACRSALAACAKLGRDQDRWFLAEAKATPRHPDALLQALEGGKLPFTPCDDLWESTTRAMTDVALGSGSRQVILLGSAPAPPDEVVSAHLLELAARNHAVLNALTVGPSTELANLCARTDGLYVTAGSNEELPAMAVWLYRTLLHHYDIVYTPLDACGGEPRLQIVSPEGLGAAAFLPLPEGKRKPADAA